MVFVDSIHYITRARRMLRNHHSCRSRRAQPFFLVFSTAGTQNQDRKRNIPLPFTRRRRKVDVT